MTPRPPRARPALAVPATLLLLAAVSLTVLPAQPADAQEPPLTLTVSTAAQVYGLDDLFAFTVRLENVSGETHTVSAFAPGNLAIVLLRRDGVPLEPLRGLVSFDDDPFLTRVDELTPLAPGEAVELAFDVGPPVADVGSTLEAIELREEGGHAADVYALDAPGSYALQLRYLYTGPDGDLPDVFRGEVLSNLLVFELVDGSAP